MKTLLKRITNHVEQLPDDSKWIAAGELLICFLGAALVDWSFAVVGVLLAIFILSPLAGQ